MLKWLKSFFQAHWLPLVFSIIVGFISVLPQILAISALGDSYQGIHFLYIDDEDNYMAMIRDIVNGHWLAGSPEYFEYKSIKPIMLPFGAYLYAVPIILFKIPIVWMMLIGKFLFPALLFLLVFFLTKKLTTDKESWSQHLNALTTGLLVTLGYELVDYGTVWKFFTGQVDYPIFSLWTRPVNPITGALLLFAFILVLLRYFETNKKYLLILAGALQASMVYYFFSWGVSLSFSAVLLLIFLARRNYDSAKALIYSLGIGVLFLLPYWIIVWNSLIGEADKNMAARNGMFFTHAPIFNKVVLAGLILFLPFFIKEWYSHYKVKQVLENWWWFCLALLGASAWALNQQIITGRTVWPYHFVQYTVALTMVATLVFVFNYLKPKFPKTWLFFISSTSVTIVGYGIAIAFTYQHQMTDFKELQRYQPLFTWVNSNAPKDCVILPTPSAYKTITLITALTHCNTYISGQVFIIPQERMMHNFLVSLRLQNIKPEEVRIYLENNPRLVSSNFFPDWNQMFEPDVKALWFIEAVDNVVREYTNFYKQDLGVELSKYKLDYVVSEGDIDPTLVKSLPSLRFVTKLDKMQVYQFGSDK